MKWFGYRLPYLSKDNFIDEYITCRLWIGEEYLYFFIVTSVYNMTSLTLERYIKVVHPLWYKIHISPRVVKISLAVPCFFSMIYTSLFEAFHGHVTKDGLCSIKFTNSKIALILTIVPFITDVLLPIITFLFCYTRIALVISRRIDPAPGTSTTDRSSKAAKKNKQIERNTLKTMLTVCLVFFISFFGDANSVYP